MITDHDSYKYWFKKYSKYVDPSHLNTYLSWWPDGDSHVLAFVGVVKAPHGGIVLLLAVPAQLRHEPMDAFLGYLVHECTHIKQETLRYIGEEGPHGDEAEAYLMQRIFEQAITGFYKLLKEDEVDQTGSEVAEGGWEERGSKETNRADAKS